MSTFVNITLLSPYEHVCELCLHYAVFLMRMFSFPYGTGFFSTLVSRSTGCTVVPMLDVCYVICWTLLVKDTVHCKAVIE